MILDHFSIGVTNIKKSIAFYDAVLGTLGISRLFGDEEELFMAYGPQESFFIICEPLNAERAPVSPSNGLHICFKAANHAAVDTFYAKALEMGATSDGAPGIRKTYSPHYYAAYVLDLDGHKIEAVARSA